MEGLISSQVEKLLKKYGPNELRAKKQLSALKIFLSQFTSPLIYILAFAGIITLFLGDFTDTFVIFAAVFLNTILGFYQEFRAQKSLQALKSLLAPRAKVIRDGKQQEIDARQVVPGDLVVLTIGDKVPADGVLIEATDLMVNEAILTGESEPVKKEPYKLKDFRVNDLKEAEDWNLKIKDSQQVFAGTIIAGGIGKMWVTKTGMATKMGKIGQMTEEIEEEKTPLQIQLSKLAKTLAFILGGIAAGLSVLGSLRGISFLTMFTTSVAVAVAAIPEGLPVSLTVILALGVQRILNRKALVRRLLAAETLGSVTTICADKTGTLTKGKLTVVGAVINDLLPEAKELLIKGAILCNDMRDPLERAMKEWALRENNSSSGRPIKEEELKNCYPRVDEIPFSPQRKLIATLHENKLKKGEAFLLVSGAPEVLLKNSHFQNLHSKSNWFRKFEEYGKRGYRLVGFAYKKFRKKKLKIEDQELRSLRWIGMLVYEDPIREGVKEALRKCQEAGIKIKVITGDYLPTALAVLEKLGLDGREHALTGEELEKISSKELNKVIDEIILFARTNPQQKLKIVKALKNKGEVVAMMGDGVNDALALKQADIGIVVNEASDVAKETADMVLLDSNFATIVHAIEEGRNIFENIKKVTLFLLCDSFTEIILIGGSILLGLPLPVTAAQILWINLIEDSLPAIALAFEPSQAELMKIGPRSKKAPILDLELKILIFGIGIILNLFLLGMFFWLTKGSFHFHYLQTVMFLALGIDTIFIAFSCRNLRKTIFDYQPFANKTLNLAVFLSLVMMILPIYVPFLRVIFKTNPLNLDEWLFLLGLGILTFLMIEGTKWIYLKYAKIKKW